MTSLGRPTRVSLVRFSFSHDRASTIALFPLDPPKNRPFKPTFSEALVIPGPNATFRIRWRSPTVSPISGKTSSTKPWRSRNPSSCSTVTVTTIRSLRIPTIARRIWWPCRIPVPVRSDGWRSASIPGANTSSPFSTSTSPRRRVVVWIWPMTNRRIARRTVPRQTLPRKVRTSVSV